ncbi:MAG: M1 family metallopeptidase [Acidobacteriota bacterium]
MPPLLVAILFWTPALADDYPRNQNVDVLHYGFHLTLSDSSDEILGEASITVRFRAAGVSEFGLDLVGRRADSTGMTVISVGRNDTSLDYSHQHDRLIVHMVSPSGTDERRTYAITYRGIPADGLIISENKYGERTFFGDNWPDRARNWLPTVDHVSDKATVDFIVDAPDHYQVVANGLPVEETDLSSNRRRTHWRNTVPIPTKVMVIGVARFAVQYVDHVGRIPVESWVYPQDRDAGFYDYAVAVQVLTFFNGHIGPYPYAKLANVQSKTRYGGMENAGNIFYNERSVTGNRRAERTIAHEIAHQWFGDSVTENDWHHVWLSEGFATYFAQLYVEFTYGREEMIRGMRQARQRVISFFKDNPDLAVVAPSIKDLNKLLNANSYQKGGWVLHMLRHLVGDEAFWKGIHAYYRQYRDANALTEDFQRVMEETSGEELGWFFRQWIYQPGQPEYQGFWHYDETSGQLTVTLNQVQENGSFFKMPVDLAIHTEDEAATRREVVQLDQIENTFTFALDAPPTSVELDPDTWMLMQATFTER